MRLGWAALGAALVAGCGFSGDGPPATITDADPTKPDADPLRPDADLRIPDAGPGDPDAMPPPTCPDGYIQLPGFGTRHRFVASPAEWPEAEADCEDDSIGPQHYATHLVVLAGGGIERGALALFGNDMWVGLTDLADDDEFEYVTDQEVVDGLGPSNNATDRDCVRLKGTGALEARDCEEDNIYICECDGREPDPARFPNPPDGNGN